MLDEYSSAFRERHGAIRITRDTTQVTVQIQDAGRGMSPERLAEIQAGGAGVGIRGMQERLRQFEAEMKIESDAGGTRVSVTIPVPKVAKIRRRA